MAGPTTGGSAMASPQCRGELLHGHPEIRKTTFNPLSQMGPLSKGRRGNTNALMYQVKKKKRNNNKIPTDSIPSTFSPVQPLKDEVLVTRPASALSCLGYQSQPNT